MTMNAGQTYALEQLRAFILNPDAKEIILSGAAGTGKTFILNHLKEEFHQLILAGRVFDIGDYNLEFTATTNKAVGALQDSVGAGYDVQTIYILLQVYPFRKFGTNEEQLRMRDKHLRLENLVIVIDEYSYISKILYPLIKKIAGKCKIIYVGDAQQLPPVNEDSCIVDTQGIQRLELTEIMRQANGNKIQAVSTMLRESIAQGSLLEQITPDGTDIVFLPKEQWERMMVDRTQAGNDFKMLGYTNRLVQFYNVNLHKIKTSTVNTYNVGDICAVNSFIKFSEKKSFKPEQVVSIDAIKPSSRMMADIAVQGYDVSVEGYQFFLPDNIDEKNQLLKRDDMFPSDIEEIRSNWIDLRHAYSCTIHKSQGSTFDEVFINLSDFSYLARTNLNMYMRLLYVGMSRARYRVYVTSD